MKIKITACQFRVEKVSNFNEFQKQVEDLITQVPKTRIISFFLNC